MILPDVTPATARALEAAARWARHESAPAVQPTHLLLGLLEEEEGRAAQLLREAGVALEQLRSGDRPPHEPGASLPFARDVREILLAASTVAASLSNDPSIASEHLLFALLLQDETVRGRLQTQGLDWPGLEATIREAQHGHQAPLELEEPLDLGRPIERMDRSRVLDAASNRAREALRVLEDYTRFTLDDALLTGELKTLRHDLAAALEMHGPDLETFLAARETQADVGTAISTEREHQRESPREVVAANCKRLQEALRSLEEFGKLRSAELGAALEQLRYRSYTLERALLRGLSARQRLSDARLYFLVTGSQCAAGIAWTIADAAAGGVDIVQLREKQLSDRALLQRAREVRRYTRDADVLFIMNDRPDLALLADADGVHLGQDELSVKDARRLLGPEAIIGVSTHSLQQLRQAILDGADYVGVGPTFPSGTKTFAEFPGLAFVREAFAATSLPVFAIGGINGGNIAEVVAAGGTRVAVSQAIAAAEEPRPVAAALRRALTGQ